MTIEEKVRSFYGDPLNPEPLPPEEEAKRQAALEKILLTMVAWQKEKKELDFPIVDSEEVEEMCKQYEERFGEPFPYFSCGRFDRQGDRGERISAYRLHIRVAIEVRIESVVAGVNMTPLEMAAAEDISTE